MPAEVAIQALRTECTVCGSSAVGVRSRIRGWSIMRCSDCTANFVGEIQTSDEIASRYSREYFEGGGFEAYPDYFRDEPCHRKQARYYLKRLHRMRRPPGDLIDIGCAGGYFLDEARRDGWRTTGCEVSDFAAHRARQLGLDVKTGPFEQLPLGREQFDVATLFSVLAHVENARTVERKLFEILRPGGIVFLETSNNQALVPRLLGDRWHLLSPPTVLHYYNRKALASLFSEADWRPIAFFPSIKWISLTHALSRVVGRTSKKLDATGDSHGALWSLHVPYPGRDLAIAAFEKR